MAQISVRPKSAMKTFVYERLRNCRSAMPASRKAMIRVPRCSVVRSKMLDANASSKKQPVADDGIGQSYTE